MFEFHMIVVDVIMLKKKKKKFNGCEPKWSSKEDEFLDEAWKTVSIDAFTGANQKSEYMGRE
jgi:hypothetical protein